jgi:hypothetical protein
MAANKTSGKWMGLILGIIILIGLYFLLKWFAGPQVDWRVMYRPNGKEPYDTYVIHELLHKVRNQQEYIQVKDSMEKTLEADPGSAVDNYIFIGEEYFIDSAETVALLNFVSNGNKAFIITDDPWDVLRDSLLRHPLSVADSDFMESGMHLGSLTYMSTDTTVCAYTQTSDSSACYTFINEWEPYMYYWRYYLDNIVSSLPDSVEVLGAFNGDYTNFIRLRLGKGEIYWHTNPIMFTNFYMKNDTLVRYVQDVFSHLGDGKIVWDDDSHKYESDIDWTENEDPIPREGPLEFILSEPSLRRAWYLLLAGVFLYLLLGARRKQKVIPVTENMENTSIEYAETIAQLFMEQEDHSRLVRLKADLFKSYLRERYGIIIPAKIEMWDDKLIRLISQRSGVSVDSVNSIIEDCKYYESITGIDTPKLLAFHNKLEAFYYNSK